MPNPTTIHPNGPPHCCLSSTITIIIGLTSASTDAPYLKDPKKQPIETRHLERFPITWNHVIEKESLNFKELEHVLIEKVEQLFRDML